MSTDFPVTVRLATPADAVGIGTCHAASWREAYAELLSAEFLARQNPAERIAVWTDALADDRNRIAVATVAVPTVPVPAVPVATASVQAGPVAAITVPADAIAGIAVPAAPTDDTFPSHRAVPIEDAFPTHPAVSANDTFPSHPAVPTEDMFPTPAAVPTQPAAPAAGGQGDASGGADSSAPGPDRTQIEEVVGFAACRPRDPDEAAAGVEVDAAGPTDATDPTDEAAAPDHTAAADHTAATAAADHTQPTDEAAASERTAADPAAATVAIDPPRELAALYVRRAFHGTGIADALLDLAVGDGPCLLWVAERNPRAIAFYRRRGFRLDGHRGTIPAWEDLRIVRMVR